MWAMEEPMVIQGVRISAAELAFIRRLLTSNPSWNRTRVSRELCAAWDWRNAKGLLKDMACRTLLLKLERAGHITLPTPLKSSNNHLRKRSIDPGSHSTQPIASDLHGVAPIDITLAQKGEQLRLFEGLLCRHHYLGYSGSVGENMKYLASDRDGRPLACVLFGSAAWKVAGRDDFIGWNDATRQRRLQLITNNMRFLILPWVRVPHLASHLLSRVAKRVSDDWNERYGHPIHLLETFVETPRFRGTCYQAANWICVGKTKGRSRNDRERAIHVPIKDIYVRPLSRRFRRDLSDGV